MDQIIPMIFMEMSSDSENKSEELVAYYNGASSEQRAVMNEIACSCAVGALRPFSGGVD